MSYYPTPDEATALGFQAATDEDGEAYYWQRKHSEASGRAGELELYDDDGHALLVEMLPDGIHAWTMCESYEQLEATCRTAFDTIAEGR